MFSFRDASAALGIDCQLLNPTILIQGASIDSRKIEPGNLFVAMKTSSNDGHRYLEDAFLKGASGAIIDVRYFQEHRNEFLAKSHLFQNLLPVDDSAAAFARLASHYRSLLNIKVIGLTGSVGKTSTKEFISYLLKQKSPTLSTEGNLNNHLGLPMTLFRLQPSHRFCVAELGANQSGDIRFLGSLLKPDVAMITAIAPVHLMGFKSLQGIYETKSEMMDSLKPGASIILPENEGFLLSRARRKNLNPITVGYSMMADYRISDLTETRGKISFLINKKWKFEFPGKAAFLAKNATMAIAACYEIGLKIEEIPSCWEGFQSSKGRFQERQFSRDIRCVDDCYNASPLSFRKSLETFSTFPRRNRKIVVISDMLELGAEEKKYHEELGRQIREHPFDLVVAYGPLAKFAVEEMNSRAHSNQRVMYFEALDQAAEFLVSELTDRDDVLLKASRGMAMEKILNTIENRFGPSMCI